jgi:hypothetical protein
MWWRRKLPIGHSGGVRPEHAHVILFVEQTREAIAAIAETTFRSGERIAARYVGSRWKSCAAGAAWEPGTKGVTPSPAAA